jgi:hypothetical protein
MGRRGIKVTCTKNKPGITPVAATEKNPIGTNIKKTFLSGKRFSF